MTLRFALPAAACLLLLSIPPAVAAPLPDPRAPRPGSAGTADDSQWLQGRAASPGIASPSSEAGVGGRCGFRLEAAAEALEAHLARPPLTPLATTFSRDAGEIAVLEDDGTFFFSDQNAHPLLDLASVGRAFYRTHGDDYDFLALYLASGLSAWLGSSSAVAASYVVRNDTQGIGLSLYDLGAEFGSASRLQNILVLNGLQKYLADPHGTHPGDPFNAIEVLAHEMAHRWCAYVWLDSAGTPVPALLGRDYQHWGFFFDSDSSIMEGCDWARLPADSFVTDGAAGAFGVVDQYLMGLRGTSEIDSFFVINAPTSMNPPGDYKPYSSPAVGVGCHGQATWWRIPDIEAVEGPRVPPAASAPHTFRMAVVLITPPGTDATAADLAKVEGLRAGLVADFPAEVDGRGAVDATLDSHAGTVSILHTPLPDTEAPLESRPIGTRVVIDQAGTPLAVDPSSVRAFWRAGTSGPFSEIPLAVAGPDSFAGTLPGLPGNGTGQYYLYASSDSAGIDAFDPPAGPSAPHSYQGGPDLTPPAIVHVPVPLEGQERMPVRLLARVTDNLGVDSVWVEYSIDGGPTLGAPVTAAGRDSFRASLGAGLTQGHRLAYRFVARDEAAAHNLGYSPTPPETLRVIRDWVEDFENGSDFLHQNSAYSYRDAWHLSSDESAPSGGTAWKCGGVNGADYPPRLDSNLYTPYLYDVAPGTFLRITHRYDVEQASATQAWDGVRLEVQTSLPSGPWSVLAPVRPYTHLVRSSTSPLVKNTPCWSGTSPGWINDAFDLSSFAPGPIRIRFRMAADDLTGGDGWVIDHLMITYPGGTTDAPALTPASLAVGRPHPNPARGPLSLSIASREAADGEWSLFDLAGRRVATLWRGRVPAGGAEIEGAIPGAIPAGLYFARLTLGARSFPARRVAVVR